MSHWPKLGQGVELRANRKTHAISNGDPTEANRYRSCKGNRKTHAISNGDPTEANRYRSCKGATANRGPMAAVVKGELPCHFEIVNTSRVRTRSE
jgi:hypothetical protein